ncbi:hypothetical protein Emed_001569 [Eimeria media]
MAATAAALGAPPLGGPPPAASTPKEARGAPQGPPASEKQTAAALAVAPAAAAPAAAVAAPAAAAAACIIVAEILFDVFQVFDRKSGKWLVVLRPTPDLHTLALRHRTQIIYHADISLILSLLDVRPGKTIIEAAAAVCCCCCCCCSTGSGSLSYSLAAALRPGGRLFTFEFHQQRWEEAKKEFSLLKVSSQVTCIHRDVCKDGFCVQLPSGAAGATAAATTAATTTAAAAVAAAAAATAAAAAAATTPATTEAAEAASTAATAATAAAAAATAATGDVLPRPHEADGVFLDLPSPWLALKHADEALKGGGRLVTFSPCVEQLHKTLAAAQELGFQAGPHEEAGETDHPEEENGPMDHRDARADTFPALLSHFLQQPLPPYLAGDSAAAAAAAAEPAAAAAAAGDKGAFMDSLKRISAYHYQLPMKGHTGYVACCVRPSEDEAFQPLP